MKKFICQFLKFWKKKPPSLNCLVNFPPKRRRVIVLHEIISAIYLAIAAIWETVIPVIGITIGQTIQAVLIVGSIVYSYATTGKKTGKSASDSGHLINTQSTSEPLPIAYGTYRMGGNLIFRS